MRRTIALTALLVVTCAIAHAQVVRVESHAGATTDIWGKYYRAGKMLTFSGRVTGIEVTRPAPGKEKEVTLIVRNRDGGGTTVVDVGPSWYVDHQVAKIKVKDIVQVTGSKVLVDGRGIILAKLIRINGQGGPVVTLRRQNGRAYWQGTEIADNVTIPTGPNVQSGTITNFSTYNLNNIAYGEAVLQTDNGLVNIDLGPQWYYGQQNLAYQIGDHVSVVVGPNSISVGPNQNIYQSYSIYNGPSIYTVRYDNGVPAYYWNGN